MDSVHPDKSLSTSSSFIDELISEMTVAEKVAQMCQYDGSGDHINEHLGHAIRAGAGSIINQTSCELNQELQRIAKDESRLGIPLLIGRDVIHGFQTIFPIPLGLAATWNPETVIRVARVSAEESAQVGINWTFSPMIDICRDPRWGRIAEGFGEDPFLCSHFAEAMIRGYEAGTFNGQAAVASCAKHFAGYGASEGGRDYNTANIADVELHNVHLPPFKTAAKAGAATFMTSFSDLNGMPASGNVWLLKDLLRESWGYEGFVVSDWASVNQLVDHGIAENESEAARMAVNAGVDMEMVSPCYKDHLESLVNSSQVLEEALDRAVRRILQVKYDLGLFDNTSSPENLSVPMSAENFSVARQAAVESCVLLKNQNQTLPLDTADLSSIALIGPLADDGYEQLGTWIFDARPETSHTCLDALKESLPESVKINYCRGMHNTRSYEFDIDAATEAARQSDLAILVLGEESILSGEAHCRANIDLPGCQEALIDCLAKTDTPIVLVVIAGRPLTLEPVMDKVDALLYAWHPGSMAGPAIVDLLLGKEVPSGKLPVTFPRVGGQIPIYYGQKPGGKPVSEETYVPMDDFPDKAPQTSLGMYSYHLDTHFSPLFSFGYGLSYTDFEYEEIEVSKIFSSDELSVQVSVRLTNTGGIGAIETAQLYVRDLVASQTRPVKELKSFKRISLEPGQSTHLQFYLTTEDLKFYNRDGQAIFEPGRFRCWVGGSADASLSADFELN